MNVAFFAPYSCHLRLFETELDLIQQELDKGNKTYFLSCSALLPICEPNPDHQFEICATCCSRMKRGINLLSPKPIIKKILSSVAKQDHLDFRKLKTEFKNAKELKEYSFDNFNIGFGVLSSLIDQTEDPEPDTTLHARKISSFMSTAFYVFRSVRRFITKNSIQKIYLFNGRHAYENAVISAAREEGIDFLTYEFGHDWNHYELNLNSLPHDREPKRKAVLDLWNNSKESLWKKVKVGSMFYKNNMSGKPENYLAFTDNQLKGAIPENWSDQFENIAIFNSSEKEWEVTSDCRQTWFYPNQVVGIERILEDLSLRQHSLRLYLRMHPNMIGTDNQYTKKIFSLEKKYAFFFVIAPESKVCSYALIRKSQKVLSFGSTPGIEAVYLGIPSVLAAEMNYDHLGCTYNPSSHEHLVEILLSKIKPKAKLGAYVFGYYQRKYGLPYKYYRANGLFSGLFKGVNLANNEKLEKIFYNIHRKKIRIFYNLLVTLFNKRSSLFGKVKL